MRRLLLVFLLGGLALSSEATLATFDACLEAVRRSFYDKAYHGVDLDALREKYRPLADKAQPGRPLHAVLNKMLAELKASHCTILERDVFEGLKHELAGERTPTCGVLLEEVEDRVFVRTLFEGGPGVAAGLRRGDRLVAIDGVDARASEDLVDAGYDPALPGPRLFFLRAKPLTLRVQRTPDPRSRRTVAIEPQEMTGLDAGRNSVRVIPRSGKKIGLVHVWYCQNGAAKVVEDAITGELRECDALVVDLRGRGGYPHVVERLLSLFHKQQGSLFGFLASTREPLWKRPVVFLIDGRTRSAKEVMSYWIRQNDIGPLVGKRTEGAVLGAGFFPLPDGAWVELPITNVVMNGVRLEGKGVAPDVEVKTVLPYAAGLDAILERGLEVAVQKVRGKKTALR